MSELKRLLDSDGDEVERALLDSAVHDRPPRRAGQKTLAALGIGGGLVASSTGAATASAAAKATAASATHVAAATGGKVGLGVLVKWVGIATVGGVATFGVVEHARQPAEPPPMAAVTIAPVARQAQAAAQRVAAAGADDPRAETETPAEPEAERDDDTAAAGEPQAEATGTVVQPDAGLGAEVRRLDQARSAMQSGQPAAALSALQAYEREFPRGSLGPEAQVLQIEALVQSGRGAEARSAAERFLARYPSSPHARRVRSLVADAR